MKDVIEGGKWLPDCERGRRLALGSGDGRHLRGENENPVPLSVRSTVSSPSHVYMGGSGSGGTVPAGACAATSSNETTSGSSPAGVSKENLIAVFGISRF